MKLTIITTFLAVQLFFAVFAWLCGYDFDSRGAGVAVLAATSVLCGLLIAVLAALGYEALKESK
jgi:hypothetical protein